MTKMIRVLHTSDWHLGRTIHDVPRDDEFDAFFLWILDTIQKERIDAIVIPGDIFDTSNASHAAQQKYYHFCSRLSETGCRHAVITSGNHDSTSFIDVPAQVLECLNVHVVGQARFGTGRNGSPADEVICLKDINGEDELIVAAVPFLNESDVRFSSDGEENADKEQKVIEGITRHYDAVAEEAVRLRAGRDIPIIAMGHLFVEGGCFSDDDGVRQTFVGTLGGVRASIFSPIFDYVALGHIHKPMSLGGFHHIRYSGSPIQMGFGEANDTKSVSIIEFHGKTPQISQIPVPRFHKIANVIGDKDQIRDGIQKLIAENEDVYVSVTYTGAGSMNNIIEFVEEISQNSPIIHCLHTQNKSAQKSQISQHNHISSITLDDLDEKSMFDRLLAMNARDKTEDEKNQLRKTFNELLISVLNQG